MGYICARHGQSGTNLNGIISGPEIDNELTEKGIIESEALASSLKPLGVRRIITSPYRRATQTAEIVNGLLKVELIVAPEYRERDFGMYVGKLLPEDLTFLYEANEGLETFAQLNERFSKMLQVRDGDLLVGHSIATPLFLDYHHRRPMGTRFIRLGNCEYHIFTL